MNVLSDFMLLTAALLYLVFLPLIVALWIKTRRISQQLMIMDQNLNQLDRTDDRLERAIRDEQFRTREEATMQARSLREELGTTIKGLHDTLIKMMTEMRTDAATSAKAQREEVSASLRNSGENLTLTLQQLAEGQRERLDAMARQFSSLTEAGERRQDTLRQVVEARLDELRNDNSAKLEQMRQTVDEKLQGTLEKRLGESFSMVSQQLENVYKSVGEMQSLAISVGDLKKVLSNVKSRGTWGEIQLGNLLEQVMAPDQLLANAEIKPGSGQRVEFAIKLPGHGEKDPEVLLPIDAKFPQEDYDRLVDAAERGDKEAVDAASKAMETRIRAAARDINEKYVSPPYSTDFAILFLPTEGLFAEVVRRPGLAESIQRESRVVLTGPTTLMALLNSLQMGFRTLAIQKRSSEVWQVLAAVKTEFGKYGEILNKVHKKLHEATDTLETVAARRRAIDRKLRGIESLPESEARLLLSLPAEPPAEEEGGLLSAGEVQS